MRQIQPQVVITFNRYGGYGHPDHIAIQRATARAFERLQGEAADTNGYCPQKLYYAAYAKFSLRMRIWKARLKGQDPRRMGINRDVDSLQSLASIEPAHARIPIARYLGIWEKASRCHASQGGGRINRTSRLLRRLLYRTQGFTRAYPPPNHNRVDEDDLFAGVEIGGTRLSPSTVCQGGISPGRVSLSLLAGRIAPLEARREFCRIGLELTVDDGAAHICRVAH